MISLTEVVTDPDFAQPFTIQRATNGAFNTNGVWQSTPATINMYGIIQPATPKELDQLAEGDRVKEVKSFHSSQQMVVTNSAETSDIAIWPATGEQYRLAKLYPWSDFGYFKALGVRILGE